jgi:tetratricopeptide (TPR) repeat protein
VLTVMARAAEHQADELRPILEAALTAADAEGEPLLSRFVIRGIQRQADLAAVSPLAAGLVAALAVAHVPPAADAAYQRIWVLESVPSYLLDDLRAALAEQYLEHVRSLAHADPKRRPDLVNALIKTRGAMMQGGREIESRALVTDAIAVARELHKENPDQYAKTLAFTLEAGSSSLMAARPDDALNFAQEAIALTEPLAGSDRNKLEALARAYQNLAFRLSSAGRHEEAVRAGEHAVAIMRETGPSGPSDVYFHRWKLSNAQTTLAHQLVAAGRVEDAVRCARQVVHDAEALEPADQMRPIPSSAGL